MKKSDYEFTMTYDCVTCAIGSLLKLFKTGIVPQNKQDDSLRALLKYFAEIDFQQSPPIIGRDMHRIIREVLNNPDPYKELKHRYNSLLLLHYDSLKQQVINAADPFNMALRFAIAGNIIDFGPNHSFDVEKTIDNARSVKLSIDNSDELRNEIATADVILYLGDNAGEIVLDRLFLETINHPKVYFAVRGKPIINDATTLDTKQVGIDRLCTVISNGQDSPGTVLNSVSEEFKNIYDKADLIISKGQGNYEGLCEAEGNIYFLLMAKCEHVAKHLGVRKGDLAVKKNFS